MKNIFFSLFLIVALITPLSTKAQTLVKSERAGLEQWTYHLEFPAVKGKGYYFISGEMTEMIGADGKMTWGNEALTDNDGDGLPEYTITTWNKKIKFFYSKTKIKWNPELNNSPYFDEESGCWIIGFVDGRLVTQAEFNPQYPGTWGDEFIRGEGTNVLYFNNNKLSKPVIELFAQLSSKEWEIEKQTVVNSWGWGRVTQEFNKVYWRDEKGEEHRGILILAFGGFDTKGEKVWPLSIDKSIFYNEELKGFVIEFK